MTGQDKKIADLELQIEFYKKEIDKCNKVNIELTEQLRIGSVSQQREHLITTLIVTIDELLPEDHFIRLSNSYRKLK